MSEKENNSIFNPTTLLAAVSATVVGLCNPNPDTYIWNQAIQSTQKQDSISIDTTSQVYKNPFLNSLKQDGLYKVGEFTQVEQDSVRNKIFSLKERLDNYENLK